MDVLLAPKQLNLVGLGHDLQDFFLSRYFAFNEGFWSRSNFYQLAFDLFLITFILYVILRKPAKEERPLSKQEKDQLIEEWEPEPMHPLLSEAEIRLDAKVPTITGTTQTHVEINGKQVLNLVRANFMGFVDNPIIKESAIQALRKCGTGTCGPRGFYGTFDVHLNLEKTIQEFLKAPAAVIYPYGFATISSVIPAFSSRGDLIIADKGVSFAGQTGVSLSRSDVIWFNHNDMEDLERILKEVAENDRKRKKPVPRRFIFVEGVYYNYGDICPLEKVVELKKKYKYRLIVDDGAGIGIIGNTGRGTCEVRGVKVTDVEILTGNLETVTSAVGGFCVGTYDIIYHQRLISSGYVYSASLPPLLTVGAETAFKEIENHPEKFSQLQSLTKLFHNKLQDIAGLRIGSSPQCPIIHLLLKNPSNDRLADEELLQEVVDLALQEGVFLTRAKYSVEENFIPPPSIRICVSVALKEEDIETACQLIKFAAKSVFNEQAGKKGRKKAI